MPGKKHISTLERYRLSIGWTLQQMESVAEQLGIKVSRSAIAKIETGKGGESVRPLTANNIARVLNHGFKEEKLTVDDVIHLYDKEREYLLGQQNYSGKRGKNKSNHN